MIPECILTLTSLGTYQTITRKHGISMMSWSVNIKGIVHVKVLLKLQNRVYG